MQKEQNILSLSNFLDQVQKLFNSHIANTKYIIKAEVIICILDGLSTNNKFYIQILFADYRGYGMK